MRRCFYSMISIWGSVYISFYHRKWNFISFDRNEITPTKTFISGYFMQTIIRNRWYTGLKIFHFTRSEILCKHLLSSKNFDFYRKSVPLPGLLPIIKTINLLHKTPLSTLSSTSCFRKTLFNNVETHRPKKYLKNYNYNKQIVFYITYVLQCHKNELKIFAIDF